MRVDPKALVRRLTPTATRMLEGAVGRAANSQHYEITVEHMLHQMLTQDDSEAAVLLRQVEVDPARFGAQVERYVERLKGGNSGRPVFSELLFQWFEDAWLLASLERQETRVRTGVLLAQLVRRPGRYSGEVWPQLDEIEQGRLEPELDATLSGSNEAVEAGPSGEAGGPAPQAGGGGAPSEDSALGRFAQNVTEEARQGRIDPIFGRHREIRQMVDILARRRKNNPIIVGEPGVGKTALVEGLALTVADGDVPEALQNVEIMALDLGALQAGAGVRGEFENRLKGVINEVKASPKPVILFIDEAHTIIGTGGPQGGGDAANLLKPALARGELRTIAATTWAEFKKYFEKDAALERRFQPVPVGEPDEDAAVVMLRGLRDVYEKAHGVTVRDEAIGAAVQLAGRYISGRQLPDKAVDLLDTTAARVRVGREVKPEALTRLELDLAALERERAALERDRADGHDGLHERLEELEAQLDRTREDARKLHEHWEAQASALDRVVTARKALAEPEEGADEEQLRKELAEASEELDRLAGQDPLIHLDVNATAVAQTVAEWTGIPVGKMKRDTVDTVLHLEDHLSERIIGQDEAIATVAESLRMAHADIHNPDSPIGVLLFVGPSGVGKTETALALADLLYGGERFLVSTNMSEFQERHTVSRLIGSPPGYVGYGEGGMLTEAVRQRPYSVVLLDECEKAHPDVLNLFYQVFDKGVLADGEGREINFRNTVVILTSNLATDEIMKAYEQEDITAEEVVSQIRPVLSEHFKPALLARMTVVPYAPIAASVMRRITRLKLGRLSKRLEEAHRIETEFTDELLDEIARRCTEVETGARNVDHILRGTLMPQVARELLEQMTDDEQPRRLEVGLAPDGGFRLDFD